MEVARLAKLVEVGDLRFDGGAVGIGERFGRFVLAPFLGGLVERFVILVQFLFKRFGRFLLLRSFALSRFEIDVERAGDGKGGRREQLPQHQRHQRALAGGKRLKVVAAQVFRDEFVEPVFAFLRGELFQNRHAAW